MERDWVKTDQGGVNARILAKQTKADLRRIEAASVKLPARFASPEGNWPAPYPIFSLPVMLGVVGGIGLLIGPAGLLWLNLRRNPAHGDENQKPMDRGFIALLFLVSASGLALLALRETSSLGLMLAIHLGLVMAFFLTMPYSKFAHGIFRSAALLKHAIEKRQPNPVVAGND